MGILGVFGNARDDLGFGRYEPKRKNHFVVDFQAIRSGSHLDTLLSTDGVQATLRSNIQSITRPNITFSAIEIEHGNEKWKVSGKSDWSHEVTAEFHDVIPASLQDGAGDVDPTFSVSAIMYDWQNLMQDVTTGAAGLSVNYKANIIVSTLSPTGDVIEKFVYHGVFPTGADRGGHSYTENDALTVSVPFSVDKIYRVGLTDTTPPSANTTIPNFSAIENER